MNPADKSHHLHTLLLSVVKAVSLQQTGGSSARGGAGSIHPSDWPRNPSLPLHPASPTWISKPKVWFSSFSKVSTFLQETRAMSSRLSGLKEAWQPTVWPSTDAGVCSRTSRQGSLPSGTICSHHRLLECPFPNQLKSASQSCTQSIQPPVEGGTGDGWPPEGMD